MGRIFENGRSLDDRLIFAKQSICKGLSQDGDWLVTAGKLFAGESRFIKGDVTGIDSTDVNLPSAVSAAVMDIVVQKSALGGIAPYGWRVNFREHFAGAPLIDGTQWRSEQNPFPVTKAALTDQTLDRLSLGGIMVWTEQALVAANAPLHFQRALEESTARDIDLALLDPSNDGVVGETPASITNGAGVIKIPADSDPLEAFSNLFQNFNGNLSSTVLIMSAERAARLAMTSNTAFQDLGANGGTVAGINVVTTQNLPTDSTGDFVVLLDASRVALAWAGIEVSRSNEASVAMIDEIDSNGSEERVNLWQNNAVGLKVVQHVNWELLDESCCRVLTGADW